MTRSLVCLSLLAWSCGTPNTPAPSPTDAVQLELDGSSLRFELSTNQHLFAPGFRSFRVDDGELISTGGRPHDADCYKLGSSGGAQLAVYSCRADHQDLRGVLVHRGRLYDVVAGPGGLEVSEPSGKSGECGFDRTETSLVAPPVSAPTGDFETRRFALGETPRFIESLVVTDSGWNSARNAGTPVADPIMTAHAVSAIYDTQPFSDRILPTLTGLVDFGASNPWGNPSNGRVNSSPYLDNLNDWIGANRGSLPQFEHAALMSGYDMGNIIGLALFESACDPAGSGALVYSIGSNAYATQTMAHEFGHLIGMDHDMSAECPSDTYIMTASYYEEGPFPADFSACSVRDADAFLASESARCIDRQSAPVHPEPRCGDGKIEGSEQCDCGPAGCEGRDPCCNEATCQLNGGATCSMFDGCCDASTCTPFAASANVECRPAQGSCDVAEVCDGTALCPADLVVETGTSCEDSGWSGACYLGDCITRGEECEYLSEYYVLDDPPYNDSCDVDAGCGDISCYGDGQCLVTSDPTPDGVPCGNGQVCFSGQCVSPATLPGADGCGAPDQDRDGDGTADCYDACPLNASATAEPCDDGGSPGNNGNNTNNGGGPNPDPGGTNSGTNSGGGDEPIVIIESDEGGGCSTAGADANLSWLVALLVVGLRRRR